MHALSAFCEKNLTEEKIKEVNGLVGAGSAAAVARLTGFQGAMLELQRALLALQQRKQISVKSVPITAFSAERRVTEAYQSLATRFKAELSLYTNEANRHKNKGGAITGAKRGITLAKRNPNRQQDSRLFVADTVQAGRMKTVLPLLRGTGYGAGILDASLRAGTIRTAHANGEDWIHESVKQVTGFGFGGWTGGITGNYIIKQGTGVGGRLLATAGRRYGGQIALRAGAAASVGRGGAGPAGWVILAVVVGLVVWAGVEAAKLGDTAGQTAAANVWRWSNQ